jgi:hypothetical protein
MNPFQFDRFKYPLLPAGRIPLLLNAALLLPNEKLSPKETIESGCASSSAVINERISESQLNLPNVRQLCTLQTLLVADTKFTPARHCSGCQTTIGLRQTEKHCSRCCLAICFDKLISEGQLTTAAWEQIRRICALPKKLDKIPVNKARAVNQLLNSFANRISKAEQLGLSDSELAGRLLALPDLPSVFTKAVQKKVQTDSGSNGDQSNEAAHEEDKIVTKAVKRKPISANRFLEVAVRQGAYCYWCGIRVIREAQIPPTNRLLKNGNTLLYCVGDELKEEAIGTIDHLLRVADGGDNQTTNLVISCFLCNLEREKTTAAYGRPFARRRVPCHSCGGRFFHPDWGCCSICGAAPQRTRISFFERLKCFGVISKIIEMIKK